MIDTVSNPTTNNANPTENNSMHDEESETEVLYEKGEEEDEDEIIERKIENSAGSMGFHTEVNMKPKVQLGAANHEDIDVDIQLEQISSFERVNNETHEET